MTNDATPTALSAALAALNEHSAYYLASLADGQCSNPEAEAFYTSVRGDFTERAEYAEGVPDDDAISEMADSAPDVYNHTRMLEAIGTGAYLNDSELAAGDDELTMVKLAGYVLYDLAFLLLSKLADELREALDAADDDDDDADTADDAAGVTP